jgi:asparagine synthase (glutamine-hydrolysing)
VLAELSGGMDSSSIVCMADALSASAMADAQRLDTVSYFDDSEPNWDERPYFTRVERQRGRAGLHIDVGLQSCPAINFASERLRILPGAEGEPSSARRKLNAFLTTNGYRVLLSGFGGDEVLGGVPSPISELADSLAGAKARTLSRQLKAWALNQRKPWLHLLFAAASRFFPPALVGASQHLRPAPWLDAGFVHRHRAALTGHEKRLRFFGPLPTFQENLATFEALRRQVGCDAPASEPAYERRTPYLDRELLEFLFAVPREQLVRPGQRRSLMRRALVGVVPQELLDRRRKAFLVRSPLIRIAEQWYAPLCRKNHMVTAFLGIVDAKAFCAEVEKARAGREILPVALIRTAGIEMWLRNLVHHGLLNAERAGHEDAQFAPKECSVSPK